MATKKTHLTPSANGTQPPRHLETKSPAAADKTRKRAPTARGAKTPSRMVVVDAVFVRVLYCKFLMRVLGFDRVEPSDYQAPTACMDSLAIQRGNP